MKTQAWRCIVAVALATGVASAAAAADDRSAPVAEKVSHVATTIKNAAVRGAQAAASGIEHGARAAAHGIKVGMKAAAEGVETGAKATARVADRVAKKVDPDAP